MEAEAEKKWKRKKDKSWGESMTKRVEWATELITAAAAAG